MAIGPNGIEIDAKGCYTDTSTYGILNSIQPIPNIDPHFAVGGLIWEDYLCTSGAISLIDNCPPVSGFTKPAERNSQFCSSDPFVVVGSYKCPPVGRPADQAFEIARQRLLKWRGRQIESTLWTGVIVNGTGLINPSFAYGNSECDISPIDVHPGGAVGPVEAFALLEESLGDTVGCGGLIHSPDWLSNYFVDHRLLQIENGKIYTYTGTQVILSNGYPGSGPANVAAAAGESWLFASGSLLLAMSNVFQIPENVAEGMNRMVNDIELRAEQFFSIGFSCALFAVRMKLDPCCP